jgi:hypothetical protein
MPKTKTPQKRTLTRVTDWKKFAYDLYKGRYGRRCVECSNVVDEKDAALYTLDGLDNEIVLFHKGCHDAVSDGEVILGRCCP